MLTQTCKEWNDKVGFGVSMGHSDWDVWLDHWKRGPVV